jgi:hypothetical protein
MRRPAPGSALKGRPGVTCDAAPSPLYATLKRRFGGDDKGNRATSDQDRELATLSRTAAATASAVMPNAW